MAEVQTVWMRWSAEAFLVGLVCTYLVVVISGIKLFRCIRGYRLGDSGLYRLRRSDSIRRRLQVWLYVTTQAGSYIDLVQSMLSMVSCGMYVWETYQEEESQPGVPSVPRQVETVLGFFFLIDYGLRFYLAKDRLAYVISFFGMVDVLTVLPVFMYLTWNEFTNAPMYLRLVRLIKFLRVLRSLRIVRATLGYSLRRRVYTLLSSLCSLIFVAAGVFHFIEQQSHKDDQQSQKNLPFHVALYYTTIETLGRPRIESGTDEGFLWLLALVALSVVLLPKQLAELFSVMQAETVYQRRTYKPHSVQHVVVMGHLDFGSVNCILYEFYHKDRGYRSCDVVLFFESRPTKEVEMLVEHPAYNRNVQYVQGSPLVEDDLVRVKLDSAVAVVVLANKNPQDVFWEDCRITSAILSCKAFHRGCVEEGVEDEDVELPRLRVLAQVLKSETREQLLRTPGWEHDDVILVISEFSSMMVGLNALHRGFTTMIFNLLSHVEEQRTAPAWYREYEQGAMQEIYRVAVRDSSSLHGAELADAATYLLRESRVILIAAEVRGQGGTTELQLFPGRRGVTLTDGDIVYCIAHSIHAVLHGTNCKPPDDMVSEPWVLEAVERRLSWVSEKSSSIRETFQGARRRWRQSQSQKRRLQRAKSGDSIRSGKSVKSMCAEERAEEQQQEAEARRAEEARMRDSTSNSSARSALEEADPDDFKPTEDEEQTTTTLGICLDDREEGTTLRVHGSAQRPPMFHMHTALGRSQVLEWVLSRGYEGDRDAMRAEVSDFLLQVGATKGVRRNSETEATLRVPTGMVQHIIVFGVSSIAGLRDLARLILLKSDRSVVVLSENAKSLVAEMVQDNWLRKISHGPREDRRLFIVKGSPSSARSLERVRLDSAAAAIFLPSMPPQGLAVTSTERQHRMIDSATVALTNFAAGEAQEELWTVTQLLHGAAVKFFTDHSSWKSASDDPRWLDITPLNTHALFAAGQIVAGTMLDRLIIETFFNDKAIPLIGHLIFGDEAGSRLFQMQLPMELRGFRWEDVCRSLLQQRLLPLGILRDSHRSYSSIFRRPTRYMASAGSESPTKRRPSAKTTGFGRRGRLSFSDVSMSLSRKAFAGLCSPMLDTSCEPQLPYVVTNPKSDLRVEGFDLLFVVGLPPHGEHSHWRSRLNSEEDLSVCGDPAKVNSSLFSTFLRQSS